MEQKNPMLIDMGKRILERRKSMNLSQEELAERADISIQVLSTAERGVKALRPENLIKISNAINVSTDYLLTGDVINKDLSLISKKLQNLTPEQIRTIEKIIDKCISLCD